MISDLDRAQDIMKEKDLDALVAFSSSNVFYLTGFHSMLAILSKTPTAFAVLPRGGEPSLVMPADEEGLYITGEYQNKKVRYYGGIFGNASDKPKDAGDPFELIAKDLKKAGAGRGRIGYDGKIAPSQQFDQLQKALPEGRLVESSNVFERLRVIKTEEEIERLRASLVILEWSTTAAFKAAREGLTEQEFVQVFRSAALAKQPESTFLQLETGFGPRGGLGGGTFASDHPLRQGEVIHFDGGILFDQYSSDMCRCATLGPASSKQKKIYDACIVAEEKAVSMLKPGTKISDLYKATLKAFRAEGFPDYDASYFGHSIGMEAHEWPSFTGDKETKIEENMVLMVEIPMYDPKVGAFNTEDCFLIHKDGPEYMTTLERRLYEL